MTNKRKRMTTIERFCKSYHRYNNISEKRAWEQRKVLLELEAHAGVPIEQVTDAHLRAYLGHLIDQALHVNTIRKRLHMVKPFFGWAFDERIVDADRLMRIKRVKPPRGSSNQGRPRPYERKELQEFWVDLDSSWPVSNLVPRWVRGSSRWQRVWKHGMHLQIDCITHLALHAGLRRSEIFNAAIDDIHPDNSYVVVRHSARKNRDGIAKPREVPITQALARSVDAWLAFRALVNPPHDGPWLSLSPFGPPDMKSRPMADVRFAELFTTIGPGYELHRFRHTCATEWLRSGLPLEQVQRLLGHSSLTQTLAYAEIVKGDLHKSMAKSVEEFATAVGRAA